MRSLWLGILLATVESLAFGQLDSNTLTVSVSQAVDLQPDQVVFGITVTSPASTGLDEVTASLKNAAIKFSSVTSSRDQATLIWFFTLAVPLSKLAATAAQLTTQKVEFTVQSSQAEQVPQCSVPTLMSAARAQASNLADAAELVVGDVLTLSSVNPSTATVRVSIPSAAFRLGAIPSVAQFFPIPSAVRANCSLTVKFKLLRYHY
jgi:uncharacterized protein YggE